jgi:hypothetical protein
VTWQADYARRFNRRGIERPLRPEWVGPSIPYVRPTDRQLREIDDPMSLLAVSLGRMSYDMMQPWRDAAAVYVTRWAEQQHRDST